MADITETKKLLDEINAAVSSYDPVLKEKARDVLLKQAFGTSVRRSDHAEGGDTESEIGGDESDKTKTSFDALIEKWTPGIQADWALLGAYYFQVVLRKENVTGFEINKQLKNHGTGIANITAAITNNIEASPARMRQVKKAGKSQQARKQYVVTTAGVHYVEGKLNGTEKG